MRLLFEIVRELMEMLQQLVAQGHVRISKARCYVRVLTWIAPFFEENTFHVCSSSKCCAHCLLDYHTY